MWLFLSQKYSKTIDRMHACQLSKLSPYTLSSLEPKCYTFLQETNLFPT